MQKGRTYLLKTEKQEFCFITGAVLTGREDFIQVYHTLPGKLLAVHVVSILDADIP
jgi:hypothetical protein